MTLNRPKALTELLEVAKEHGWSARVLAGKDNAENEYLTVEVWRSPLPMWTMIITWHSRPTGGKSLRLFSKIWRHVPVEGRGFTWVDAPSLVKIRETIAKHPLESAAGSREES